MFPICNPSLTFTVPKFQNCPHLQSVRMCNFNDVVSRASKRSMVLTLETLLVTHWGTLTADRVIKYLLKNESPGQLPFHWNIWMGVMANNSHRYTKEAICLPHKGIKHTSPARAKSVSVQDNTWGSGPVSAGEHTN